MSTPNKPGGLPLIPKFHNTGLTAKQALTGQVYEPALESAISQPVQTAIKASKAAKVPKVKAAPLVAPGDPKADYSITLPAELWARLRKQPTGSGGWQSLMIDLFACTEPDEAICHISPQMLGRLINMSVKHGSGGYQGVVRHLICLVMAQHMTYTQVEGLKAKGGDE